MPEVFEPVGDAGLLGDDEPVFAGKCFKIGTADLLAEPRPGH